MQRAKPDGYTLMLTASSSFSGAALFKTMPFDPVNDFTHIARIGSFPSFVASDVRLPVTTIQEFVAYAKANPGKLSYGHGNNMGQIVGEILKLRTGINMVRVPYRSSPAGVTDLIAGQLQMMVPDFGTGLAHAQGGRIRALATFSKKRHPPLPDVPTVERDGDARLRADRVVRLVGAGEPAAADHAAAGRRRSARRSPTTRCASASSVPASTCTTAIRRSSWRSSSSSSTNWTALIKDAGLQPEG